jgi:predicted regulator of amino acid metabolism with ACT domain
MAEVSVTVSVDDEHIETIGDVAAALSDRGMHVQQVLEGIGSITGSVPEDLRQSLNAVDGVADVSEALEVKLPPPDSPIQ